SEPASTRRTRFSMPLPTKVVMTSSRSGDSPSSTRSALAARARSGAVSSRVPSRSNSAASSIDGLSARDLGAQLADDLGVVGLAEDRRAGHEGVGPGRADLRDVVHLHAAVHFQQDALAAGLLPGVDARARGAQL